MEHTPPPPSREKEPSLGNTPENMTISENMTIKGAKKPDTNGFATGHPIYGSCLDMTELEYNKMVTPKNPVPNRVTDETVSITSKVLESTDHKNSIHDLEDLEERERQKKAELEKQKKKEDENNDEDEKKKANPREKMLNLLDSLATYFGWAKHSKRLIHIKSHKELVSFYLEKVIGEDAKRHSIVTKHLKSAVEEGNGAYIEACAKCHIETTDDAVASMAALTAAAFCPKSEYEFDDAIAMAEKGRGFIPTFTAVNYLIDEYRKGKIDKNFIKSKCTTVKEASEFFTDFYKGRCTIPTVGTYTERNPITNENESQTIQLHIWNLPWMNDSAKAGPDKDGEFFDDYAYSLTMDEIRKIVNRGTAETLQSSINVNKIIRVISGLARTMGLWDNHALQYASTLPQKYPDKNLTQKQIQEATQIEMSRFLGGKDFMLARKEVEDKLRYLLTGLLPDEYDSYLDELDIIGWGKDEAFSKEHEELRHFEKYGTRVTYPNSIKHYIEKLGCRLDCSNVASNAARDKAKKMIATYKKNKPLYQNNFKATSTKEGGVVNNEQLSQLKNITDPPTIWNTLQRLSDSEIFPVLKDINIEPQKKLKDSDTKLESNDIKKSQAYYDECRDNIKNYIMDMLDTLRLDDLKKEESSEKEKNTITHDSFLDQIIKNASLLDFLSPDIDMHIGKYGQKKHIDQHSKTLDKEDPTDNLRRIEQYKGDTKILADQLKKSEYLKKLRLPDDENTPAYKAIHNLCYYFPDICIERRKDLHPNILQEFYKLSKQKGNKDHSKLFKLMIKDMIAASSKKDEDDTIFRFLQKFHDIQDIRHLYTKDEEYKTIIQAMPALDPDVAARLIDYDDSFRANFQKHIKLMGKWPEDDKAAIISRLPYRVIEDLIDNKTIQDNIDDLTYKKIIAKDSYVKNITPETFKKLNTFKKQAIIEKVNCKTLVDKKILKKEVFSNKEESEEIFINNYTGPENNRQLALDSDILWYAYNNGIIDDNQIANNPTWKKAFCTSCKTDILDVIDKGEESKVWNIIDHQFFKDTIQKNKGLEGKVKQYIQKHPDQCMHFLSDATLEGIFKKDKDTIIEDALTNMFIGDTSKIQTKIKQYKTFIKTSMDEIGENVTKQEILKEDIQKITLNIKKKHKEIQNKRSEFKEIIYALPDTKEITDKRTIAILKKQYENHFDDTKVVNTMLKKKQLIWFVTTAVGLNTYGDIYFQTLVESFTPKDAKVMKDTLGHVLTDILLDIPEKKQEILTKYFY